MCFVHLHVHSELSFLAGTAKIDDLVEKAKNLGFKALALTDCNRMSGLISFYKACLGAGIKPILGAELSANSLSAVVLAKNLEGYGDLCELISQRQLHGSKEVFKFFNVHRPNLVWITSDIFSLETLAKTPNRHNLYAELVNHNPKTRCRSRELEKRARKLMLPMVVTNDVYLLEQSDWEIHRLLRAIDLNASLSFLQEEDLVPKESHLRSAEKMYDLFPNHCEALSNTLKIADNCNVSFKFGKWIMPEIPVPKGFTPDSYLQKLALKGLEKNYGSSAEYEKARDIQKMELDVIKKLGYSSYFLMVKDVWDWTGQHFSGGYRRSGDSCILRGSAANSISFYNLGVGSLDPISQKLYFQRFLNEDRASPPDADLDFGWDEREEVLDYVRHRFGEERVAITCTTNCFRGRAAFREVAKVHGYSDEEISLIQDRERTTNFKIKDADLEKLKYLSYQLNGRPRFLGQHPGGLLITNQPICRHVALERSGGETNRVITQIDMHSGIDELGLIKFDLLGNGSLSVLRDSLEQLHRQHFPDPGVWNLEKCYTDKKVQNLLSQGRTRGIFYIESPAQSRLNKKCQAQSFEEITITSSLVRPAGAEYAKTFVERHRKKKMGIVDWEYLHPSLKPILPDTHDVFAFQEDVTKACHMVAGLSYKKADKIRKMMNSLHDGKVSETEWEETSREFIEGCQTTSGLSLEQAVELWTRVSSFTGFSFCKSHSASYAQLSFRCAFLKAHYPAQFLSAVISNSHGFYSRDVYINEARRWGLNILALHINHSDIKYYGKDDWIRPGFMHVRGLSSRSMEQVVAERKESGIYRSLRDFASRTSLGKKETESLILVGAFDGLGLSQPELLYQLEVLHPGSDEKKPSFFTGGLPSDFGEEHPGLSDYTLMEKCLNEERILGYILSGNMLDVLELHPAAKGAVPANQIPQYLGRRIKIVGKQVTERFHEITHSKKNMLFLTLEDKTENVDVIFWPDVLDRFQDTLASSKYFEVYGKVTEDWGSYSLEADSVRMLPFNPNLVDFELASQKLSLSLQKYERYSDVNNLRAA